jgi:CheY-like chemotaxis protein
MQMPIVDGLTSTKMIRSFEKVHQNILSPRAALCGRVPIIAVSASLVERLRQTYIDAGFDAWILKPISFSRLSELLTAIVDTKVRGECLYQSGQWEKGGWFHTGQKSSTDVRTTPSGKPPQTKPSVELEHAASSEDPMGGDTTGIVPDEQHRLHEEQKKGKEAITEEASSAEI